MTSTIATAPPWPRLGTIRLVLWVGLLSGGPPILVAGCARLTGPTTRVAAASLAGTLASRIALPLPLSGTSLTTRTVAVGAVNSTGRVGGGALAAHDALLSRLALAAAWLTLTTSLGIGGATGGRAAASASSGVSGGLARSIRLVAGLGLLVALRTAMPGGRGGPTATTAVPATLGIAISRSAVVAGLPGLTVATLAPFGPLRVGLTRLGRIARILTVLYLAFSLRPAIGRPTAAAVAARAGSASAFTA